jgi:hypothetical protein
VQPARVPAEVQNSPDNTEVTFDLVVNRLRKALGQYARAPPDLHLDSRVPSQGMLGVRGPRKNTFALASKLALRLGPADRFLGSGLVAPWREDSRDAPDNPPRDTDSFTLRVIDTGVDYA